jgi:hypothetical protein
VLWGYGGEAELTQAGAWALAAEPSEVVELVVGSDAPTPGPRL